MKVGDKVIVDPRLHGCIWCIPVEEVKGKNYDYNIHK